MCKVLINVAFYSLLIRAGTAVRRPRPAEIPEIEGVWSRRELGPPWSRRFPGDLDFSEPAFLTTVPVHPTPTALAGRVRDPRGAKGLEAWEWTSRGICEVPVGAGVSGGPLPHSLPMPFALQLADPPPAL